MPLLSMYFIFNLLAFRCQNSNSHWQKSSSKDTESQSSAAVIEIEQYLVISRALLPNTEPAETIFPTHDANSRAETKNCFSKIKVMFSTMLSILFSDRHILQFKVFQIKPNHSITWHGSHRHLSSLIINPDSCKSDLTRWDKPLQHASRSLSVNHPSSRKSPKLIPLYLQYLTSGFNILVKICGAVDSPNGKTVNTKYLHDLLLGNLHANPKNV